MSLVNIGRDPNFTGLHYWSGKIAEILIANSGSTTQQVEDYEAALAEYYDITLM